MPCFKKSGQSRAYFSCLSILLPLLSCCHSCPVAYSLNNNSTYSFSGTYAGEVQRRGHIKKLAISSDAGATAEQNIKICTLPADYLPLKKIEKWIILRGNITALLAINMSGEVNISHISGSVSQGTWISVVETYI